MSATIDIRYRCLPSTAFLLIQIAPIDSYPPVEKGNVVRVERKDVKNGVINFSLSDIKPGGRYLVTIEAIDGKNNPVDRLFLKTFVDGKKKSYELLSLTGRWVFEKPVSLNKLVEDTAVYDGIFLNLYQKSSNNMTHECFIYNKDVKKRLHDVCVFYDENRLVVTSDYGEKDILSRDALGRNIFRGVALDFKKTDLLQDTALLKEADDIFYNLWEVMKDGRIRMNVIEVAARAVDSITVENERSTVDDAVKKLKDKITDSPSINFEKEYIVLSKVPVISFYRKCKKIFKTVCFEYDRFVIVALDIVDVFLQQNVLRRQFGG